MPGKWDTSMKHLLGEHPEHFIRWLLPAAQLTEQVRPRPTNLNDREIEADNLFEIILNRALCIAHFECQSYRDDTMAKRTWTYNALATFTYDLPTYSFVIYLRKCVVPEPFFEWTFPTGQVVHRFDFTIIKLWEIPVEVLRHTGLVGIFPLMVLAKGGKQPAVVEEVITGIEALGGPSHRELLSLTYILASLVFENDADRTWLKRRFKVLQDILRDTWAYQEIMQDGREEGLAKERLQRLKDQRQVLMTIVEARFHNLGELAKKQAEAIEDPEVLQHLVLELFTTQSEEQAEQTLLSVR